ncbi:hypothetical protein BCR34DRAFT_604558 [Clohesyomyces aquaticus]|uniref:Uncharacterized protein n=1 Tax=Clohesyomyces aquaticus TaxID=1231657 RepID=A0A1Y1Z4T6_9PLEO|nr:hypothetical protein BCR34DRAFT_604558 [Clohesyomyces aquaticus]
MERIFPIRCTIFDDSPNLSSAHQKKEVQQHRVITIESSVSGKSEPSAAKPTGASPSVDLANVDQERPSRWPPSVSVEDILEAPPITSPRLVYTERAEYAYTDEQGHSFVSGKRDHITRCEDEPIRIPGAIQSHGMLIGLEVLEGESLRYVCRVVSENSEAICKYTPRVIFGLDDFLLVLPAHQRLVFRAQASSVLASFKQTDKSAEPRVFSLSFFDPSGYIIPAWCAMHYLGGGHDLLICEFELQENVGFTQAPLDDLPSTPYNTLDSDPLDAPCSFASKSEPLSITADVGELFHGDGQTMAVVNIMSQIQHQLSNKKHVQDLLDAIVGIIQELTAFHRCMVYRFDEEYNGSVVAELINPQACKDVYRGLHFPASDIPKQARDLYKINRVRVLFDRERLPSRLICRNVSDLENPLDLTHSYLRAMSPVHLKYLQNMSVRSTMSISLDYKGELWGLICCHSYSPTATKISFPVRELCYWVGLCASNCLDKLLNAEKLKARNSLASMKVGISPQVCASASSEDLLQMFEADFGFLVVQGEARTLGKLSSYLEAVTLLRYVYFRNFESPFGTKNITKDFTDLVYEQGFDHIAGLMFIPLSNIAGDFIVFFRKNQIMEVHWAGNPQMSKIGPLEPRNSFVKWTETVKGTCKPWTDEQFEAAAMTRLVYGNFVRVWREKEAVLHESRMKRLLLTNISHEVRTPLNAVVNYLEIALEKPLGSEMKALLTQSHAASKSLVYVVDDLLHLTGAHKQPPPSTVHVAFDLPKGIQLTLDQLKRHTLQKSLYFNVVTDEDFPRFVNGDLPRLQQSVTGLVSNAIKNTVHGGIVVHLGARSITGETCVVQISVQDSGKGMTERELDDLFQEFEQVPDEEPDGEESPTQEKRPSSVASSKESMLGLSLALLARYIKHCGGQIRGQSVAGKGSTFSLDIPMRFATEDAVRSLSRTPSTGGSPDESSEPGGDTTPRRPSFGAMKFSSPAEFQLHLDRAGHQSERSSGPAMRYRHRPSTIPSQIAGVVMRDTPRKVRFTVLIADDNPVNLSILQRRLSKMGHEVKTSRDGQHCFETFQRHRHDVEFILMDLNMPLVDGIQSTAMIRTIENATLPSEQTLLQPNSDSCDVTPRPPGPYSNPPHSVPTEEGTSAAHCSVHTSSIVVPQQPTAMNPLISPPLTNPTLTSVSEEFSGQLASYFPLPVRTEPSPPASDKIGPRTPHMPEQQQQSQPPSQTLTSLSQRLASTDINPETTPSSPPPHKRIPIFAVSASLDQHSQESLEGAGFDGWLSKPIDFKRLGSILEGTISQEARVQTKCKPDDFAGGGWFS